jgi:hypothetical protein
MQLNNLNKRYYPNVDIINDDCFSTMKELSSIIHQFVQEKQQALQHEFQYKREMLILLVSLFHT